MARFSFRFADGGNCTILLARMVWMFLLLLVIVSSIVLRRSDPRFASAGLISVTAVFLIGMLMPAIP